MERLLCEHAGAEEERQRALQGEEEEARMEERKKYKSKFTPVPDRLLPLAALLPSQHTLTKLHKGDYVPLYLFTNKGVKEVEGDGSGDNDHLMLVQTDKSPTFRKAAAAKAKEHKVKDEHISWEEFG